MAEKNNGSWPIRFLMWQEIQTGKTEEQALDVVLPAKDATGKRINKRRVKNLNKWKAGGLWPIPPEELQAHGITVGSIHSDHSDRSEQPEIEPEASEQSERSEHGLPVNWQDRVREIAKEVCHEMMENIQNELKATAPTIPGMEEDSPPAPKDITRRKQNRIYGKVGATVDGVLVRKLNQEAHDRQMSVGKLLDEILWNRYKRPLLSFQVPDVEQEDLRAEFQKPKKSDAEPKD